MIRTIEVTKEHISKGKPTRCDACPVALAFQDAGFKRVNVRHRSADIDGNHVSLPPEAGYFISSFDNGTVPLSPFTFLIELP